MRNQYNITKVVGQCDFFVSMRLYLAFDSVEFEDFRSEC